MKQIQDLKQQLLKETKRRKIILLSSVIFLIGSILPWYMIPYPYFTGGMLKNVTQNGWHGIGFIGVLAAIFMMSMWIILQQKPSLKELKNNNILLEKILASAMLASPIIYLQQIHFTFSITGIGLWLSMLAGGISVYFAFQNK